jgi:phosphate transport system protein
MGNWLSSGVDGAGFKDIQERFGRMMEDGRHIFSAAANALLGGADPDTIREDLFSTDKRINEAEQQIRRLIVVHGTVNGARSFPYLLILMSVAKDAERIGDYAKNIFDLVVLKPFYKDDDRAELIEIKDRISEMLLRAMRIYLAESEDEAREFLTECDQVQDACDAILSRSVGNLDRNYAGLVLTARYFKRVVSHAGNVVTSVIQPLHKLDFYDED